MTILDSLTNLLKSCLDGDPPPPAILQTIGPRLDELTAVSVDPSGSGIDSWLAKLRAITNDKILHDTLIVRALQMNFPRLAEALTLLNIIQFNWADDGVTPIAFPIDWVALNNLTNQPGESALMLLLSKVQKIKDVKALQALTLMLISAPQALLKLEYKHEGFTALPLDGNPGVTLDDLDDLIDLVNSPIRVPLPLAFPTNFADFKALVTPPVDGLSGSITLNGPNEVVDNEEPAAGLDAFGLEILIKQNAPLKEINLGNGWVLTFKAETAADTSFRVRFSPNAIDPAVKSDGELTVLLTKKTPGANAILIGDIHGTHFAIQSIQFGLRFHSTEPLFDVLTRLEQIEFVLKPDFLKFLSFGLNLPTLLKFNSDIDVSYVQGKGLTGQGSAGGLPALGVQFAAPLNLKIGGSGAGVSVDQVVTRLELKLDNGDPRFRVMMRYGAKAEFGPLSAVMDGAGVWFGRWTEGTGGLLPPQGIGLSLNAGPVSGGGFLKIISENEFAGGLQIKILGIGAFAYGLFKVLPSGDPSFVALIGIRLPLPGIQLSFGFAVSGFGGLVGVNRRADTDKLRERLASGSAGDVLFNDNPMKDAPKLLGDMQLFFPDEKGIFLIGPTLQINWLYILKLDVGVFIELPGPRKLFIAGSARLVLGSEDFALVYLRMDFIGGIDFTKSLIFFDAALVNSHVLGIFRITGGVALRIAYGVGGYFLFSVGGFHPSFNPQAMEVPRVARVGVGVSLGIIWIKQEMYLAITSNTFQLGSRIEAGLDIGPIAAHGWFGFDALIQFKPFYFVARIDAGFDVEVFGVSLCSVRVEGQLSGPGPLVLQAKASVRLLFVKASGSVTITLSGNPPEEVIAIGNLPDHLKAELSSPDNLRIEGEDESVVFAAQKENIKLFAPVGELIWEQKRAPLNTKLEKIEGINLSGLHTLTISIGPALPGLATDEENDWFGVGTYLKMDDGQALNNSRFEEQQSGLRIGTDTLNHGVAVPARIEVNPIKLPKRSKLLKTEITLYTNSGLYSLLSERATGAKVKQEAPQVAVTQEVWNAHSASGVVQNSEPLNSVQAFTQAQQANGIALPASEKALDLTGVL